eukprot:TRINITY_DN14382_c0_g1_i2.p1 TRINITY_DN14382_c0_g1~~TRINITY_DN14382_c0_g1_i2.p1  ORF type:complete len:339 (-),score=66.88 TRINITY_DN14382_c0_g1_i2:47-1042(-)
MTADSHGDGPDRSTEEILLEACLASSGERLASLSIRPDSTVADLCLAAAEAVTGASAADVGKKAPAMRGITGFRVIANGRILEDDVKVSSTGLLEAARCAAVDGKAAPVVDFIRCRPGHVATAGDSIVKVWSGETGECATTLEVEASDQKLSALPQAPRTTPDGGRFLRFAGSTSVKIYMAGSDAPPAVTLKGHDGILRQASFSSDGLQVVTASEDGTARIWNALTGKCRCVLQGHSAEVLGAVFSPDCKRVVTTSSDATARIWNADTGSCEAKLVGHRWAVNSAAFSWDNSMVITGSDDRTARIWEVNTGECVRVLDSHRCPVIEVCFLE